MSAEMWAVGIIITLLLAIFGYVAALSNKIAEVKTTAADELGEFREYCANEYAKNGSLDRAVSRMVDAVKDLTLELRQFKDDFHKGTYSRNRQ